MQIERLIALLKFIIMLRGVGGPKRSLIDLIGLLDDKTADGLEAILEGCEETGMSNSADASRRSRTVLTAAGHTPVHSLGR